ncbi:MAG: hypothetical protein ABSA90_11810 [Xanthobacteraceae bacterium]|jgi:hypothetical protein
MPLISGPGFFQGPAGRRAATKTSAIGFWQRAQATNSVPVCFL